MPIPPIVSRAALPLLTRTAARYIRWQRDRLEGGAREIPGDVKGTLGGYFKDEDLERVRIVEDESLRISGPPFAKTARRLGLDFPDTALVSAITFDHVIAARETMSPRLLFHELVHVVQYRLLGVQDFARHYTRGFLLGGSYDEIPLERCAYQLDFRYMTSDQPFDVETEVRGWIEREL